MTDEEITIVHPIYSGSGRWVRLPGHEWRQWRDFGASQGTLEKRARYKNRKGRRAIHRLRRAIWGIAVFESQKAWRL